MSTADYPKGYATGFLDVIPIGDDGDMYIVPGHDAMAGFKIAAYVNNEEQQTLDDIPDDWEGRHIWVTEETRIVSEDVGGGEMWDEELPFYTFWDGPFDGAEPYTAIGYWANYRAGKLPS